MMRKPRPLAPPSNGDQTCDTAPRRRDRRPTRPTTSSAAAPSNVETLTDRVDNAAAYCAALARQLSGLEQRLGKAERELSAANAAISAQLDRAFRLMVEARRKESAAAASRGPF